MTDLFCLHNQSRINLLIWKYNLKPSRVGTRDSPSDNQTLVVQVTNPASSPTLIVAWPTLKKAPPAPARFREHCILVTWPCWIKPCDEEPTARRQTLPLKHCELQLGTDHRQTGPNVPWLWFTPGVSSAWASEKEEYLVYPLYNYFGCLVKIASINDRTGRERMKGADARFR